MSISKKPQRNPDEFIDGAPDSAEARQGLRRGRRRQITLTVHDELLADVDAVAQRNGISRSAAINQAMRRWADAEG
jgi:hypothetical protein